MKLIDFMHVVDSIALQRMFDKCAQSDQLLGLQLTLLLLTDLFKSVQIFEEQAV